MSSNTRKELETRIAELSSQINASTSKQPSVPLGSQQPQSQQEHAPKFTYSHTNHQYPRKKPFHKQRHVNMSLTNANSADTTQPPSWVTRRSGNMSLLSSDTLEKTLHIKASRDKEKAARRASKKAKSTRKSKQHQSITKDGRRQIIIDGVPFEFDETGGKLVKVSKEDSDPWDDDAPKPPLEGATESSGSTPKKMTIDGTNYVRTKSGNLVRDVFARKRNDDLMKAKQQRLDKMTSMLGSVQKARNAAALNRKAQLKKETLTEEQKVFFNRQRCTLFTKTGRCSKALHCPFIHDSAKTAICPHFLRKKCRNSDSACSLSHHPSPNNMPHCTHFESQHGCRAGAECMYTHVHLNKDALVCRDFAVLGFCDSGVDCDRRHVRECPDYAEAGDCKNPSCKLPHIIKSEASKAGIVGSDRSSDASKPKKRKEASYELEEYSPDYGLPGKRIKSKRKTSKDDLTQQSDFVTFDDSNEDSSGSSAIDSDQESVNSDDFALANESIPLY
ncbi:hypothetical protein E3P99_03941 [Wallemia hederae]|uniref:C3H1-type domain-containing protein n=1 Tax=Wallemia hederae TaxID=1540922 RepID=A0A4T0FEN6_9BASI|nr:hypothetical protein E3P99_03941 [Wallemia hederae]